MARTHRDLGEALDEQICALVASSRSFDEGEQWEAKRLATVAYTLLHDGGRNSRSLLGQIGKKDILFTSTCRGIDDTNLLAEEPLTMMRMSSEDMVYLPIKGELLDSPAGFKRLKFSKWWEEPVFKDMDKRWLSRKNLIFSLRSQEGGSHFDPALRDDVYKGYKEGLRSGWMFRDSKGVETFVAGGPLATMRQVAWEIADTLIRNEIGDAARLSGAL
jgi:hypothetical protein